VRKFFIFFLSVSLASAAIFLSSNFVYATSTLSIPPTAEGPGLILPDSPLYFLDQVKQEFRLLLAFTPEQKARIHNAVAGERMAELRFMLAKNNPAGIRVALLGISDNLEAASEDVTDAKLTGRNIDKLAEEMNNSIKEKQKILSVLGEQATGELQAQVAAVREALKTAKTKVEEDLPPGLLISETIGDLNLQIGDNINSASLSAEEINRSISILNKLSSRSAQEQASSQSAQIKSLINEFQKVLVGLQAETTTNTLKSVKNSLSY
jgi:gas vesicle protein